MISCETPSAFLAIQNIGPQCTEDQLRDIFRQFAIVKSVSIARDVRSKKVNIASGIGFVEFHSADYANFALESCRSTGVEMGGYVYEIAFANEVYMTQLMARMQQQQHLQQFGAAATVHPLTTAALTAAAQWPAGSQPVTQPSSNAMSLQHAPKVKPSWPPSFDQQGGAFVFQSSTGYFFEPLSEFYYVPRTKMYYNSADATYYRYNEASDPPFDKVDAPAQAAAPAVPPTIAAVDSSATAAKLVRKPVVISLGANGGTAAGSKLKPKSLGAGKKVLTDLAKWGSLQQEEQEEMAVRLPPSKGKSSSAPAAAATAATADQPSSSASTAAAAEKTKAVCVLCKRQFSSADQLARHEKESQLHQENLAKQQRETAEVMYRDRASERREKVGSDPMPVENDAWEGSTSSHKRPRLDFPLPLAAAPAPPVPLMADAANIGNLLIRKMGWSEGSGLGRDGSGIENAIGVEDPAGQQGRAGVGAAPQAGSGYKQSLYHAAKARFDQLDK